MTTTTSSTPNTHRVVVTGCGILTSMGAGWQPNLDGFREGRIALSEITLFDTSRQRVHTGGQANVADWQDLPAGQLSTRQRQRLDRPTKMLIQAGSEALASSGLQAPMQAPWILGTSAGAMSVGEEYFRTAVDHPDQRRGQATRLHIYQPQIQAALAAAALKCEGPITIIANACASGANAIGHAFQLIRKGRANYAIAGGYDALAQLVFAGFDSLQALSPTTPRPFDANRDGLAIGEGAAIMIVESLEHALQRGAENQIIAEIIGYGASTDLHHLTQPNPEGDAALLSMQQACQLANLTAKEIDYINSHGTGTPLNDVAEGRAIQRWADKDVASVAVSSTKASIGHLLGGAGAVEAVICTMAIQGQFLPPTTTVQTPDPICTFDLVTSPRKARIKRVLTNSFGFGGANATVIMQQYPPDNQP